MSTGRNPDFDPGEGANTFYGSPQYASSCNRFESGVCAPTTSLPNLNMDFDLAAPLKDPATFLYDDPLLYEHLQILGNAAASESAFFPLSARIGGENSRPLSPAWPASDWNMPGGFEPLPEDAMDVDSAASFVPSVYYDQTRNFQAENSLNYGSANGYEQFQFAHMYSAKTPQSLDVDQPVSYVSEDISPDHRNSQGSHMNGYFEVGHGHPSYRDIADAKDTASHRTSILAALNELLPLTTTTSFTPLATSLHLAQPSYFSAQQYLRPLIENQLLLLTRASMDFYQQRRRPSHESENSGPHVPVRLQRSLASYFHFRDRKLPMLRGPSPALSEWMQQLSQPPRHLIRSIFKTNNGTNGLEPYAMDPLPPMVPPSCVSQGSDENPYGDIEGSVAKKSKRSKRNLFTRFKPTKTQDTPEQPKLEQTDEVLAREDSDNEFMEDPNTVSAPVSKGTTTTTSLHHVDSAGLATAHEPDYAALFTGVGKRRNLVSKKNKKKADPEIKPEVDADRVALNPSLSSTENSADCVLVNSVPNSLNSFNSKEEQPLAFANASKRILGSRLMKKKPAVSKSEPSLGDVVEIDLQSLDLPVNTEILSNTKLQNKIRGRKEDKAADMVDQSKIYVCGYCDRRFKRQEHLKRHFRSLHTAEKPYDCPICEKKFSRTDNLNQHLKVHKQEEEEERAAAAAAAAAAPGN